MKSINKILWRWLKPLEKNLHPVYLVGGSVRDCLLNVSPKDIDLVCMNAETAARQIAAAHNAAFVPFLKKAGEPCYRVVDKNPDYGFIDIAPMRGGTLISDLKRRDFTINAMAIKVEPDKELIDIIDPLNGSSDLEKKIIKMTGPEVFNSDPLRMLRAFRFSAKLGFAIEEKTLAAVRKDSPKIKNTASERILYELLEIFKTGQAAPCVRLMDEAGILELIFPEIPAMKNCSQNAYHHLDVWNHSLAVLENCEGILARLNDYFPFAGDQVYENLNTDNRLPLLKLGAMLHDSGKPESRSVCKDTGRITFYGHETKSGDIINAVSERLRMSGKDKEFIYTLVTEHMHVLNLALPEVKPVTLMRWFRNVGEDVISIIIHGMADIMSIQGPEASESYRENFLRWAVETVNAYYNTLKPRLERSSLINGKDLMKLGVSPGPEMGKILKKIRDAQDSGMIEDREAALKFLKSCLISSPDL